MNNLEWNFLSTFIFATSLPQIAVPKPAAAAQAQSGVRVPPLAGGGGGAATSLCPNDYSGLQPFPADCGRFVNCWKGRPFVQRCAPGTEFSARALQCDFPGKVEIKFPALCAIVSTSLNLGQLQQRRRVSFAHPSPRTVPGIRGGG